MRRKMIRTNNKAAIFKESQWEQELNVNSKKMVFDIVIRGYRSIIMGWKHDT